MSFVSLQHGPKGLEACLGIVGTMGFGPDPPANRPRQTQPHKIMAQSVYGPKTETHSGPAYEPNHLHLQARPKHTFSVGQET